MSKKKPTEKPTAKKPNINIFRQKNLPKKCLTKKQTKTEFWQNKISAKKPTDKIFNPKTYKKKFRQKNLLPNFQPKTYKTIFDQKT